MTSIRLEAISKAYGATQVLEGLDLHVGSGERIAVHGPSGAGKTTVLRLIAGLEFPDSGRVLLDDQTVSTPTRLLEPHKRSVGLVFQSGALWPHMTVMRNVTFGLHEYREQAALERAEELLRYAEIDNLRDRYPDQLSAGQARRLALVRAMAPMPRLLLLDEPLVNVEPELRDRLATMIVGDTERTGATVVHVTHDAQEAQLIADRIVALEYGRVLE